MNAPQMVAHLAAAMRMATGELPVHPVFGPLDAHAWGVLALRHCDHHLRQFGV